MCIRPRILALTAPLFAIVLVPISSFAQWIDGAATAVCTASNNQTNFLSVPDGHGGVIIVWLDCRSGCYEIYAQRLDASGYAQWGVNGVLTAGPFSGIDDLVATEDGIGGIYFAWVATTPDRAGFMSENIYAQRIDEAGNPVGPLSGIPVCLEKQRQEDPQIASVGAEGGAVVAWNDARSWDPAHPHIARQDIYWQRLDGAGNASWNRDGSVFLMGYTEASVGALFPDGLGGLIITYTNGAFGYFEAGVRRFDRTFTGGWTVFPTLMERVFPDGAGGVVGSWTWDGISTMGLKVDSLGVLPWGTSGKIVLQGIVSQWGVSDGRGGAVLAWDGFVQRIDREGIETWTPGGVAIGSSYPLIEDGFGGAIAGSTAVQRIDSSGNVLWGGGGLPTVANSGAQLVSDGVGGVILVFGVGGDIFAQRVNPTGHVPDLAAIGDRSVDLGDTLTFQLSAHDPDTSDVLVFSTDAATVLPSTFAFDSASGLFSWIPQPGEEGDYVVSFFVTDGRFWDRERLTISVFNNGDRPPVLQPIGDISVYARHAVVVTAHATDPDGDDIDYSISDPRFAREGNVFTWQTAASDTGAYEFIVSASDGFLTRTTPVSVTVMPNRAPSLRAIGDIEMCAGSTVVIEARATDREGDAVAYAILDPRFVQEGAVFSWQTMAGDIGRHLFVVTASDGWLSDSTTATVTILSPDSCLGGHRDRMFGDATWFLWRTNEVRWVTDLDGYLSGYGVSWYSAAVSNRSYTTTRNPSVSFRLRFVTGQTNYIVGFTPTAPDATDYYRTRVKLGLYLHSSGSLRPSWSVNDTSWNHSLTDGVYDVRVEILWERSAVRLQVQRVSSHDAPLSTFVDSDWSVEVTQPLSDLYYIQINPYNPAASIYDVWDGTPCFTLDPIDERLVWEGEPVVITAHAMNGCGSALAYGISDSRYSTSDSVFTWHTHPGDAGVYRPVVSVSKRIFVQSAEVDVTVLSPSRLATVHDGMSGDADSFYAWHANSVAWHPEEGGYLCGETQASWDASIVSEASRATADKPSVIVRFLRSAATHLMAGFRFEPPGDGTYGAAAIDCGVYVDSAGSIRPTWKADDPGFWSTTIPEGIYDLRVDLDRSAATASFALVRVPRYDDPLPDFASAVWRWTGPMTSADTCYIQINPYNDSARVFDVWSFQAVPATVSLQSHSASPVKGAVALVWTLANDAGNVRFHVYRAIAESGDFAELASGAVERENLTYTFMDRSCEPMTAYRYRVEAEIAETRTVLFVADVEIPPAAFRVLQNHPNPFGELTTFSFEIPTDDRVTLDVYNVRGERVARIVDGRKKAGRHDVSWNGTDDRGSRVSPGIYFYRVAWGGQALSRKALLLR